MIRESLSANSAPRFMAYEPYPGPSVYLYDRPSTGAGTSSATSSIVALPRWVKLVRSGSTFSGYSSADGVTWTQLGGSLNISMAQNVYIGLAVSANDNAALATANFDKVSISTATAPAPSITSVTPKSALAGTQVVISGSGFGASQGNSAVLLNDAAVTVNSWSATSISITIPAGGESGTLVGSVAATRRRNKACKF